MLRLSVKLLQLLVELLELLNKVDVLFFAFWNANVPPRVQTPAVPLYLLHARHLAESRHVDVLAPREVLLEQRFAATICLDFFIAIKTDYVPQKLDLLRCEVAVRAIELAENVPSINEQHLVFAVCLLLALLQKPERARERHVVKEI